MRRLLLGSQNNDDNVNDRDMRFRYCPDCGRELGSCVLGDEGAVPWCDGCGKPWFPVFPCCVICLVHSANGRVLLLNQNYISTEYMNLVSGYITPGESAEECAVREIKEETGLEVVELRPARTWWFGRKQMLMVGFLAKADDTQPLVLSGEVDGARWVDAATAPGLVHPAGSVSHALAELFLNDNASRPHGAQD